MKQNKNNNPSVKPFKRGLLLLLFLMSGFFVFSQTGSASNDGTRYHGWQKSWNGTKDFETAVPNNRSNDHQLYEVRYSAQHDGFGGGSSTRADICISRDSSMWNDYDACWRVDQHALTGNPLRRREGTRSINSTEVRDFNYVVKHLRVKDANSWLYTWAKGRRVSIDSFTTSPANNPQYGERIEVRWNTDWATIDRRLNWSGSAIGNSGNTSVSEDGSLSRPSFTVDGKGGVNFTLIASGMGDNSPKATVVSQSITLSAAEPDLFIRNRPEITSGQRREGETLTFEATVRNGGQGRSWYNNRVRMTVDGNQIASERFGNIDRGNTETIRGTWNATAGQHTVQACVDINEDVPESDEGNNCSDWTFSVSALPPEVDLSANPGTVDYNNTSQLRWTVSNATSCSISPHLGSVNASGGQRNTPNLTSNTNYTLTCRNSDGVERSDSANVNVRPGTSDLVITGGPNISSGSIREGDSIRFSGSTRNDGVVQTNSTFAMGFIIDGSLFDTEGTNRLNPGESRTETSDNWTARPGNHTIRICTDYHNEVTNESNESNNCSSTRSFSVASLVAPSVTLTANPTSVAYDGSTTLTWAVTPNSGVNSCTASGDWSGGKNRNGSNNEVQRNLRSNKTYRIQCSGPGGNSSVATANVTVSSAVAPSVTLTANPTSVAYDGSTTLTWAVTPNSGVNSCTASGDWSGGKNRNGSNEVQRNLTSSKTYRIQCTGVGGSSSVATASVSVSPASAPTITSFTASPSTVDYGNSTTLSWAVSPGSGVSSCTASGDWSGSKSVNGGSQTRNNLRSNQTYFLQCSGVGGNSNQARVDVTVNPATGTINVQATLNGSPWTGTVNFRLSGPGNINGSSVSQTYTNQQAGNWTMPQGQISGGPSGSTLSSIQVSSSQSFSSGGSITFTLVFTSTPPTAPSSLSANNSTCQQISLSWNDNSSNEDGFRVYRGSSLGSLSEITTVGANTTAYVDTSVSGGSSYYYGVTSYNTGGESARATTGPVFVNSCAPNLALSTMVVDQVNGSNYTGQTIQNGDTLTLRVVISNTGTASAYDVYVDSTLTSNLVFAGNARLNGSSISTSGSGQSVTLNSTQNLGDKGAGGSNWIVLFDATVSSSASQSVDFFKADGVIRYSLSDGGAQDQSRSVGTGLIPLRTGSAQIPNIREVAP